MTSLAGIRTYVGTFESLSLPSISIEVIGDFDVLEHLENSLSLLNEINRVLKPRGLLIVTVSAHQWLYSNFDASIGHYKGYSRREISAQICSAKFQMRNSRFLFSVFCFRFLLEKDSNFIWSKTNFSTGETVYKCPK